MMLTAGVKFELCGVSLARFGNLEERNAALPGGAFRMMVLVFEHRLVEKE
jgi:hypothetical protein